MSETYSPSGWVGTVLNRFTSAEAATGTFGTMDRNNITTIADKIRYLDDANGLFSFPATQVASAGANVFDDYEEGDWTGAFTCGTSGTITINAATGSYTKKGREVTVTGRMSVTSVSSPLGALSLTGLPFTSGNNVKYEAAAAVMASGLTAGGTTAMQAFVGSNSSSIQIFRFVTGDVADAAPVMQAGSVLRFNLTYNV